MTRPGRKAAASAIEVVLPQRTFTKPLAKALVEQRLQARRWMSTRASKVQLAMDALMIEPDRFMKEAGVYLGMRMIAEAAAPGRIPTTSCARSPT